MRTASKRGCTLLLLILTACASGPGRVVAPYGPGPDTLAARLQCAASARETMAYAVGVLAESATIAATLCTERFLAMALPLRQQWSTGTQEVAGVKVTVELRDASPHLRSPFRIDIAASVSMAMFGGRRHVRPGFGVPVVVASRRCDDAPICRLLPPSGVFRWATAWIEHDAAGGPPRLILAHPVRSDPLVTASRTWPLAIDSSAFYASGLRRSPIRRLAVWGLFGGRELGRRAGVYLLEDYDPRKRPLVMIHGLGSHPLTWARLSNAIWAEPELRSRYQVWQVVYETDEPILVARRRIQEQLDAAWTILDPERNDPAREQIVLIGHSMGGVISRLLLVDTGDALWQTAFTVPPQQLDAAPDDIEALQRIFRFGPYPGIRRAVFIAAPHGGSPIAGSWRGAVVRTLVGRRTPEVHALRRIAARNPDSIREALRSSYLRGWVNSITTLHQGQPVMNVARGLPAISHVPFHSIAGQLPGSEPLGDGVVPIESALLPGSASTLVVSSGHAVHEHEAAIEEVLRILRLDSDLPAATSDAIASP